MLIKLGQFEFTECWDNVLYKNLPDYPKISDWELQSVSDFIEYERQNGRECELEGDASLLLAVKEFCAGKRMERIPAPEKITECTACPSFKGCLTDMVCHTSPQDSAAKILACGSLLSPVLARRMSAAELKAEKRNAANDPEDYFSYIMLAWGNCQAGDRLVMERKLGRFPNETDLSRDFTPGVRFFFDYDRLIRHPNAVFDGVLPLKVKDEIVLKDWVRAIIIPSADREKLKPFVPAELKSRTYYVDNDCKDIWEWSEKVYLLARNTARCLVKQAANEV
jgi:hypothetical protein